MRGFVQDTKLVVRYSLAAYFDFYKVWVGINSERPCIDKNPSSRAKTVAKSIEKYRAHCDQEGHDKEPKNGWAMNFHK